MPLYILKIGGSVITDKNKYATARKDVIHRIAKEIRDAKAEQDFKLILVNGAGSFGHMPVKKYGLKQGITDERTKLAVPKVQIEVENLNRMLWDALLEQEIAAWPLHPHSFIVEENRKIKRFETEQIKAMLDKDIMPLLYGDMVIDTVRGASIISGDDIVPYLAKNLDVAAMFFGTDTSGIYTADPKKYPDATRIDNIDNSNYNEILQHVGESAAEDVTGGMKEKLRKIVEQAAGKKTYIFDASKERNV